MGRRAMIKRGGGAKKEKLDDSANLASKPVDCGRVILVVRVRHRKKRTLKK